MRPRSLITKIVVVVVVSIASLTFQSAANDRLSIPFLAETNDKFTMSIKKERIEKKGDETTKHIRAQFLYDGLIKEVSDDGLTISWILRDFNAEKIAGETTNSNLDTDVILQFIKKPILFRTDAFGNPAKLKNLKELRDTFAAAFGNNRSDKQFLEYLDKTLFSLDDETAARVFLQEAALLGRGQSFEVPLNETVEEVVQLPNPLGGPLIDTIVKTRVLRDLSTHAEIETTDRFDPESAKRSIREAVKSLAETSGASAEKIQEQFDKSAIGRDDVAIYSIEKRSGWTQSVALDRKITITIDGVTQERLETWKIQVSRQ
jgi:hypothetical protein